MKKRLAVSLRLVVLFILFSLVFVSAHDLSYNAPHFSTAPLYNGYYKTDYYSNDDCYYCYKPYPIYSPCPIFSDYKTRSYGHGTQLVRFRLDPISYGCVHHYNCNNYYDAYLNKPCHCY